MGNAHGDGCAYHEVIKNRNGDSCGINVEFPDDKKVKDKIQ